MPDAATRGRFWSSPFVLAVVAILSLIAYNTAPPSIANFVIFLYAGSVVLAPSIVYPWLRHTGRTVGKAIAGSLFVPLLWVAKECFLMSPLFSAGESLYYAFNPLALGLFFAAALQMAVSELGLQRLRLGSWDLRNGAGLTLLLLFALAGSYAMIAWREDPSYIFWVYIDIHRRLFSG